MDDDFEELIDVDEDEVKVEPANSQGIDNTTVKQEQNVPEVTSTEIKFDPASLPTENELRLGEKVFDLEKENARLFLELEKYRSRYPDQSTTIPVPSTFNVEPITIPDALLPVLALFRNHISDLTRENQALRYTFIGKPSTLTPFLGSNSSSSKSTLDTPLQADTIPQPGLLSPNQNAGPLFSPALSPKTLVVPGLPMIRREELGIDLEQVLSRVKELIKENEELGDMLLQAGTAGGEEWMKALDESKAVITSLDSDLTHHLSVIETLRAEISTLKAQSRPQPPTLSSSKAIPSSASNSHTHSHPHSTSSSHREHHSSRRDTDKRGSDRRDTIRRDSDRRDSDRRDSGQKDSEKRDPHRRDSTRPESSARGGEHRNPSNKSRSRSRSRERRSSKESTGKRHDREAGLRGEMEVKRSAVSAASESKSAPVIGLQIKGAGSAQATTTDGKSRKDDDRAYKRRK